MLCLLVSRQLQRSMTVSFPSCSDKKKQKKFSTNRIALQTVVLMLAVAILDPWAIQTPWEEEVALDLWAIRALWAADLLDQWAVLTTCHRTTIWVEAHQGRWATLTTCLPAASGQAVCLQTRWAGLTPARREPDRLALPPTPTPVISSVTHLVESEQQQRQ